MPVARRLRLLLLAACMVLLMCGVPGCLGSACDEASYIQENPLRGTYKATPADLAKMFGEPGDPDKRTLTDAYLSLGPLSGSSQAGTNGVSVAQANGAQFDGVIEGQGLVMMYGTFTQDGNDVTVNVVPRSLATAGTPQSIEINLTFTDDDHASGTLTYVESGDTYRGDIDIQREIVL